MVSYFLFLDCSYHFTSHGSSLQTISLPKAQDSGQAPPAPEFLSSVMTAGVKCHSLSVTKVEVLDDNMEWKQIQKEFYTLRSVDGYYYIRVSIDIHLFHSVREDEKNKFMGIQNQKRGTWCYSIVVLQINFAYLV